MQERHKPKHRNQKQKNKKLKYIFIVLFVLTVGLGLWIVLQKSIPLENQNYTTSSQTVTEKNDASIAIPGYEGLTLKADTKQQEVSLKNPTQNDCYFIITLYLEDGTELWKSDFIKAGDTSKPIKLNQTLSAGNYSAKLNYACFAMDKEKTPLNGAEIKLTLRVK